MIAGYTKFASDILFALLAKKSYSSDVFNQVQLIDLYQQYGAVTFDDGGIDCSCRDVITKKYVNMPRICSFHEFLVLKNPGFNAEMKVRDECYNGPQKRSPMKLKKDFPQPCLKYPTHF